MREVVRVSGIDPIPVYHFDPEKLEVRSELVYPQDVLDEMARRFAEHIEDEVTQQVLARLGYVKASEKGLVRPVRCCDCEMYEYSKDANRSYCRGEYPTEPYGYCAWGKRREEE